MEISIIIVNYNTCDLTLQCLQSVYEKTINVEFEVIVVDNASSDKSIEMIKKMFPQAKIIESVENLGFGKANNLGAKYANGDYLFLLNSDTILVSNVILEFYRFMQQSPQVAACGGSLIDTLGNSVVSHGKFPSLLQEFSDIGFYRLYPKWYKNHLSVGQKANEGDISHVDYLSGADVFIRRSVWDNIQGFFPQFFMYYEETDMFCRMRRLGYNVCLRPMLKIIHLEGGSFDKSQLFNLKKYAMVFKSKVLYYQRNKPFGAVFLMKCMSLISVTIHSRIYRNKLIQIYKIIISTR